MCWEKMANDYSVTIHHFISDRIEAAENNKKVAEQHNDLSSASYYNGQLQELNNIRQYMVDKIDLKTQKYY